MEEKFIDLCDHPVWGTLIGLVAVGIGVPLFLLGIGTIGWDNPNGAGPLNGQVSLVYIGGFVAICGIPLLVMNLIQLVGTVIWYLTGGPGRERARIQAEREANPEWAETKDAWEAEEKWGNQVRAARMIGAEEPPLPPVVVKYRARLDRERAELHAANDKAPAAKEATRA